jgi:hypothetical protein
VIEILATPTKPLRFAGRGNAITALALLAVGFKAKVVIALLGAVLCLVDFANYEFLRREVSLYPLAALPVEAGACRFLAERSEIGERCGFRLSRRYRRHEQRSEPNNQNESHEPPAKL